MKYYIDKLKEIETLIELSIGNTMTKQMASDIYAITNDLMCKVKKLNKLSQDSDNNYFCKCGNKLTDKELFYETCLKCNKEI